MRQEKIISSHPLKSSSLIEHLINNLQILVVGERGEMYSVGV